MLENEALPHWNGTEAKNPLCLSWKEKAGGKREDAGWGNGVNRDTLETELRKNRQDT